MSYQGDIQLGQTLNFKFTTVNGSGVPTTLAGSPTIACYPANSITELTAGISLTVDFDARTGMHQVTIAATSGNGYLTQTDYDVVITAGTVGGNSVVGYVVGSFSIENRALAYDKITLNGPGPIPSHAIMDMGTAQAASSTTLQMRAADIFPDNALVGATVWAFGSVQGYWQRRQVNSSVGASDTLTVDPWDVTPTGTISYIVFGTAPASVANAFPVNVVQFGGNAAALTSFLNMLTGIAGSNLTTNIAGNVTGNVGGSVAGNVSGTVAGVANIVDVNIIRVNGGPVTGAGTTLLPWGPG